MLELPTGSIAGADVDGHQQRETDPDGMYFFLALDQLGSRHRDPVRRPIFVDGTNGFRGSVDYRSDAGRRQLLARRFGIDVRATHWPGPTENATGWNWVVYPGTDQPVPVGPAALCGVGADLPDCTGDRWRGRGWGDLSGRISHHGQLNHDRRDQPVETAEVPLLMLVAAVCLVTGIFCIQRQANADQLLKSSLSDPLTGLLNRRGLYQRLKLAPPDQPWFVALIDLDRFKGINDQYGHVYGDAVLRQASNTLLSHCTNDVIAARIGGDELVIAGPIGFADTAARLNLIQRQLSDHLHSIADQMLSVTASVGWVITEAAAIEAKGLHQADQALYAAKSRGGNRVCNWNELYSWDNLTIQPETVKQALFQGELFFAIQPIIDANTELTLGYEALIRWRRDDQVLAPGQFIQALLKVSRDPIVQAQMLQMQSQLALHLGPKAGVLTFNLTIEDLLDRRFVDNWLSHWHRIRHQCPTIVIEISESASVLGDMTPTVIKSLERLRTGGFQIALDDFGKDHSNLSRLVGWPVDRVKLDKSLIDNLSGADFRSDIIVGTVKSLCDQLRCTIIAEGIETQQQSDTLKHLGVHLHQGYYWGRPVNCELG